MASSEDKLGSAAFTATRAATFGPQDDYSSYRRDAELWLKLTSIEGQKQGIALLGSLHGEPKAYAKTLPNDVLLSAESDLTLLQHLDKAYAQSPEMTLNQHASEFLDYQLLPSMTISTYLAGFYARLDRVSAMQMRETLKGHLMLKQANLSPQKRAMVVATAQGNYDVSHISTALLQFFGEGQPVGNSGHAEHYKHDSDRHTKGEKGRKRDCICGFCKKKGHIKDDCYEKKKMMKL